MLIGLNLIYVILGRVGVSNGLSPMKSEGVCICDLSVTQADVACLGSPAWTLLLLADTFLAPALGRTDSPPRWTQSADVTAMILPHLSLVGSLLPQSQGKVTRLSGGPVFLSSFLEGSQHREALSHGGWPGICQVV